MSKVKYYYDSETLSYRKIEHKKGKKLGYALLGITASLLAGFLLLVVYLNLPQIETPKEKAMRRELQNMELQYEVLNKKMTQAQKVLAEVQNRDNNIYRVYFEANPIPEEQRKDWPKLFHLSSGSTEDILIKGAQAFNWEGRWHGWGKPYSIEGPKRRAVGVGTGAHVCGVEFEGNVSAVVRINPDGSAKVYCAVGRQGQGSETTQAQVAAEELGIPFDKVEIETGDTDSCPWSHGSLASNTMFRVGWATQAASKDAKRQLLEIAAREFFGSDPGELDVKDGMILFKDNNKKDPQISIEDVLNHFRSADALGQASSITGRPTYPMPPSSAFARHFAAHFVDLEVDIETGEIKLLDWLATQDSGTIMNPQVMKNQMIGGAICGAGFAIYESLVFDEETGRIKNANLLDYKLLRAADFPVNGEVIYGDSYDPVGPFGARGAGEAPAAAAGPAIAQAVYNAIGMWVDMPMTPENIITALHKDS